MLHTARTFPFEYSLKEADVVLLGIPWDSSETGKSVKHGPLFIREAIKNIPGWDPDLKTNVFEKLKFCDLGDLEITPANWELTRERIHDTIKEMLEKNPKIFPIVLGGDHLITLGILEAFAQEKTTVIHFDAHRDLLPDWMDEKHSHITWANHITNNRKFELIQIGCRSSSPEEEETAKKYNIKNSIENITGPVYITIDLDVFDPSHAPEVGTPEPLGMNPKEILDILEKVSRHNVIGMDIV
jgi:agmatinase